MEKIRMTSRDLTAHNIERIAELFPNVLTEAQDVEGNIVPSIDFDMLRQELSDHIVEGPQERYHLDWPGKRAAAFAANTPIAKTLRPVREESVDFDTTKNLFIEGDNLDALKLLQESYLGKVKLIYIDPPYNTGNDFVYADDFAESTAEYLAKSKQVTESGERLVANSESNGRFHSDWLSMMYPRLKLARNLLTDDGIVFVSIDDSERDSLAKLMDEVFSSGNFIGSFVWRRRSGSMDSTSNLSMDHEYVLVYSRGEAALNGVARTFEKYTNPDDDPRGPWISDNLSAGKPGGDTFYEIIDPATRHGYWPPAGRFWPYSRETMAKKIAENRVIFPTRKDGTPMLKRFQNEAQRNTLPVSSWIENDTKRALQSSLVAPMNSSATKALSQLLGGKLFSFPKSVDLIKNFIQQATETDSIIMDFFAGSASTMHAVMALNSEDGGRRQFIGVQLDEPLMNETAARNAGYQSIAAISRERIRRAGKKLVDDNVAFADISDLGFRALRVDSANLVDNIQDAESTDQAKLDDFVQTIRPDRTGEDLLFQVLLNWGLELTVPIVRQEIDGREVFNVDDDALLACFEGTITPTVVRTLAEREPLLAVFRDDAFESDAARINAEQIFKEISPTTEVRTI